ncbi:hypothetical protein Scep_001228 [Stephania cephalantha]|uniref:Uncharacterized protein n=1 Tax=Stephania cephalantha TaxID=152367 RepID=A0AAP0L917_9MAGN
MDESILDVDQVENLLKFCRTKEEMEMLKGYSGDKENLGKCEQVAAWEKPSGIGGSISTIPGFNFRYGKSQGPQRNSEPERNNQYFSSDSVFQNDNPVLSKVERVVSLPSLK